MLIISSTPSHLPYDLSNSAAKVRMPHRVVPSNHGMNSMRKCVIKNAAVDLNSECDYGMKREEQKQPPISVDPADLGKKRRHWID